MQFAIHPDSDHGSQSGANAYFQPKGGQLSQVGIILLGHGMLRRRLCDILHKVNSLASLTRSKTGR
jgi:hypothetical protein